MVEDSHDGEKPVGVGFIRKIDQCPGCGSGERFFESILGKLKGRGLLDVKVACFDFQLQEGLSLSPSKIATLVIGSEVPAFKRIWDTCSNCGMVYSVHLEVSMAQRRINLSLPQPMPNRAQRRQIERLN